MPRVLLAGIAAHISARWSLSMITIGAGVAGLTAYVPAHAGLGGPGHHALFVLLLASWLWITSALPPFAVSLLVIALQIALLGDPAGEFSRGDARRWEMFVAPWASPVMWLFLSGLILATAAQRTGLDRRLAAAVLGTVGNGPRGLLLGVMGITFVLSMFMSNTAWLSHPLDRRPDVSNPSSLRRLCWTSAVVACLTVGIAGCMLPNGGDARPPVRSQEPVNPQARAMAEFQQDVKAYMALQQKLAATLPPLPPDPTPHQIDARQHGLADLIRAARKDARAGDLFDPEMQKVVRNLIRHIFSGPDGAELKAELMDENPGRIRITINGRYPDAVPLSTVPPQLLAGLPKLPPEMEYRFIGRALILFDSRSHLILDIMENAVP